MQRFGQIIGVDPDRIDEYAAHHDNIWPEIVDALNEAGITNYSIYFHGEHLFAYYEYDGPPDEYEARMRAVADAPRMAEWWALVGATATPARGTRSRRVVDGHARGVPSRRRRRRSSRVDRLSRRSTGAGESGSRRRRIEGV